MIRSFFLYFSIFCLSICYSVIDNVKDPLLLNIGFQYTIITSPLITESHIIVPIQKQGHQELLIYNTNLKKQTFVSLNNKETILDKIHTSNNQIFFITSQDKKKNIMLCDLKTYKLTRINTIYESVQFHFHTPKKVLFTAKNKKNDSFIILDLRKKKIIHVKKSYYQIHNVIQVEGVQAIAIGDLEPNKSAIVFIDLKKNIFKESQQTYRSISCLELVSSNNAIAPLEYIQAIAIGDLEPNKSAIVFIDLKKNIVEESKQTYRYISCLKLISSSNAIAQLDFLSDLSKIGFIDLKKKLIKESAQSYSSLNLYDYSNEIPIGVGINKLNSNSSILFIDSDLNQVTESSKKYKSVWNLENLSKDKILCYAKDENGDEDEEEDKLSYLLNIDIYTKNMKEMNFTNIRAPNLINKEKILAYQATKIPKIYSLGFIDPNTGIFEEKIKDLDTPHKYTIVNELGQGIIYRYGAHKDKLLLLNMRDNIIQKLDEKYEDITFGSFTHPCKLFGLARIKNKVSPVFINYQTNTIEEFEQSYQKIVCDLCINRNNTLLALVLNNVSEEILLHFDSTTEKINEYIVKEQFNLPFNLKYVYSFCSNKSAHALYYDVALVNNKKECIIKEVTYAAQTYFIPYKNQLLICSQHIENVDLKLD